jgi:hypothetical protein
LLAPLQHANELKSQRLYGEIQKLKMDYRALLEAKSSADVPDSLIANLSQLETTIQKKHEEIEARQPVQVVPFRAHSARPTALGNVFAVFEEYPLDRYGIDGTLVWPRLRQVVDERILGALDNSKMFLDFQLNLSLLASVLAVESVFIAFTTGMPGWWVMSGLALFVAWEAYSSGVRVARSMGTLVTTSFDLYRGKLLGQFGIVQPPHFFEEYKTWLRLCAFLRRGELFYWPSDL